MESNLLISSQWHSSKRVRPIFKDIGSVSAITYPPLQAPPPNIPAPNTWQYFHDELQPHIQGTQLLGMGHSLGGALLLYDALKHPGRWATIGNW